MQPSRQIVRAAALLSVAFSTAAAAEDAGSQLWSAPAAALADAGAMVTAGLAPEREATARLDDASPAAAAPFGASAIQDRELGSIAGREDINQVSYAEQVAGVSKSSVGENSITGNARISDNAFQNMSGLSILNVNTGNNVAINASMNVNISFLGPQ